MKVGCLMSSKCCYVHETARLAVLWDEGLELKEPKWKNLMQKLDMAYYHCSMPMLENVHVALWEVLEVRSSPLQERELWGLLHQIVVAVQDLFLKGTAHKDGIPQQLVTVQSTQCTSMGKILISSCTLDAVKGTSYWCDDMTKAGTSATDLDIEKMYVFTIGETLHLCSEYTDPDAKQQQLPKLSPVLTLMLQTMRNKDSSLRMRLSELVIACCTHGSNIVGEIPFPHFVCQLYGEVLGSIPEHDILAQVGKDVSLENEQIIESVLPDDDENIPESRRPSIDFIEKSFTYGHRLGYQPVSLSFNDIFVNRNKIHPKQRWKDAVAKIVNKQKAQKALKEAENFPNSWRQHKAKDTIFKVYEELTERRKMLELLRISINIGSSVALPVDKDNALTKGLKPKTLAELVMLLQCPNKAAQRSSFRSKADNRSINSSMSCLRSDSSLRSGDGKIRTSKKTKAAQSVIKTPLYSLNEVLSESTDMLCRRTACSEKVIQGPEFVLMSIKPAIPLTLNTSTNKLINRNRITSCHITVVLLNGCRFDISCDTSVLGRDVHTLVTNHLSLPDNYIFGLAVKHDGEFFFLDCREKLLSQVYHGWKTEHCRRYSNSDQTSFTLYWRVKFHIKDIPLIRHPGARHHCYLQCRRDILEGRIHCESEKAMDLAGLALQAEFGDFCEDYQGDYFLLEHYLPYNIITQVDRSHTKEKLYELHKSYCGLSKEIAESEFLQEVQTLPEYGYHFYKVLQSKKHLDSYVWLGISEIGIDVFEEKDGKKQKSQEYLWREIYRISYTSAYFCLMPRTESLTGRHVRFKFYVTHPAKCQSLFNLTMSHHQFFVRLKSRARASELFSEDFDDNANDNNPSIAITDGEITSEGYDFQHEDQHQHSLPWQQFTKGARYLGSLVNLRGSAIFCRNNTPRISSRREKEKIIMPIKPLLLTKYQREIISGIIDPARPVMRSPSTEHKNINNTEEVLENDNQNENHCKKQKPEKTINGRTKTVKLTKEPGIGLGLTITCGNTLDSILFGALIESIKPGGPAEKEGSLKKGDRIISVNGEAVDDVYYLDVVDMIQNSPPDVELVVESQNENTDKSEGKENNSNISELEIDSVDGSTKISNEEVSSWSKDICHPHSDHLSHHCNENSKSYNKEPPVPKPRKKWSEKVQTCLSTANDKSCLTDVASHSEHDFESIDDEKLSNLCTITPVHLVCKEAEQKLSPNNANEDSFKSSSADNLCDTLQNERFKNMELYMNCKNSAQDENISSNPDNDLTNGEQYMPGDVFCVTLKKTDGSLGMNIEPKDVLVPGLVYVCSLVPNGSAEIDGRIKPGDKLLEVDGVRLDSVPYCEAVNLLRNSPETTNIVVQRGRPITAETVFSNSTQPHDKISCSSDINHDEIVTEPSKKLDGNMKKWQVHYKKSSSVADSLQNTSLDNSLCIDLSKNGSLGSAKDITSFNQQQHHSDGSDRCLSQKNTNTSVEDDPTSCDTSSGISTGSSSLYTSAQEEHVLSELPIIGQRSKIEKYTISAVNSNQNHHIVKTIPHKNSDTNVGCANPHLQDAHHIAKNGYVKGSALSSPEEFSQQKTVNGIHTPSAKEDTRNKGNRSVPVIPPRRIRQLRRVEDINKFLTPENTFVVHIRKSSRGLGLSICGGRDSRNKSCLNQLIRIRKLYPLQPAMECEKLQVGDVIIEVNGKSTLGLSHTEALDALRAAPADVMLKIHHPDPSIIPNLPLSMRDDSCPSFSLESPSSSASSTLVKSHSVDSLSPMEFEISLTKIEGSLGFTVVKRDSDGENIIPGLYVKELIREPAKSDGRIRPGDQILQVNGTDISEMTHNEAVNFLRNSPQEVILKLCRSDPPLSPLSGDEEPHLTKPLRREAVELLTDWARQKKADSPGRKRERRRVRSKHDDSFSSSHSSSCSHHSSYNQKSNICISDSDHNVLSECTSEEELSKDDPGLQRILRPKSLDILNSSNGKKLAALNSSEYEVSNLYRQTSVALPNTEQQAISGSPHLNEKSGQGTLLRWRGTTLPKNESNHETDLQGEVRSNVSVHSNSSSENNQEDTLPFNVEIVEVSLDRGWHGRLGFSICDPINDTSEKSALPNSPEVKIVHAGSLAASDGRIKAGDRLIQVNKENVEGKAAVEVIDILRKTRGLVTMVFVRMRRPE